MTTSEERSTKRQKLLGSLDRTVTLLVGENKDRITVHTDVLCKESDFFRVACKPDWKGHQSGAIQLPKDDLQFVSAMVYWMYHDKLPIFENVDESNPDDPDPDPFILDDGTEYSSLYYYSLKYFSMIFILGKKYRIRRLRNHALDAIYHAYYRFADGMVPVDVFNYVYENTDSHYCRLRKLLVDITDSFLNSQGFRTDGKYLKSEVLYDLFIYHQEELKDELNENFCEKYHEHEPNTEHPDCTPQAYDSFKVHKKIDS